jgi:hypothetical protein
VFLTHNKHNIFRELLDLRTKLVRDLGNFPSNSQIAEIDRNIMDQLDEVILCTLFKRVFQLVYEQQSNLCCVGIPLFKVTKDYEEIRVQIEIIKFIQSLADVFT